MKNLFITCLILSFATGITQAQTLKLTPIADAYVRNGSFGDTNFGSDTSLIVKSSVTSGFSRVSYLKFSLTNVSIVRSATLRLYGSNKDNAASVKIALFGVSNNSWTEDDITFNNAPSSSSFLADEGVNNIEGYHEFDVTNFVKAGFSEDKMVSFLLKDTIVKNKNIVFNSKENGGNLPQLIIDVTPLNKPVILAPTADAYVRGGAFSGSNFGTDTALVVKSTLGEILNRYTYLKFSLGNLTFIRSARVRLYLTNKDNSSTLNLPLFGVNNDAWTETDINFINAPKANSPSLTTAQVNNQPGYYEFDVTDFARKQLAGDKVASFLLRDTANKNTSITFNSRENGENTPQLVIDTAKSNASLFVENMDGFPSNDNVVFSHIQIPWTRDTVYNTNHDSVKVRLHNKGINPLIISSFKISVDTLWKIDKLNGKPYNPSTQLPATINTGGFLDLMVKFTANKVGNQTSRAKVLHQTLTITSNDDKAPEKKVYLHGLWQYSGEGKHEPYLQEILATFGYKTNVAFGAKDPDLGDTTLLKGDEIKPDYLLRADTALPVTVVQMAAYHGCCHQEEFFRWFSIGNTSVYDTVFLHGDREGQTLLPRKSLNGAVAGGTMTPSGAFGVIIGEGNTTDPSLNNPQKFGVRIYKVFDGAGNIVPDAYILANDYLGAESNYDYNDNVYYVTNIKPHIGTVYHSPLEVAQSDLDFGEKVLQTNNSLTLKIFNGGKIYPNGSKDPAIIISSVLITGENQSEFSVEMPSNKILDPQEATNLHVKFNPLSQGLKIADMLIYYNNAKSPKRVPLYGIAKDSGVTVKANYRINSGAFFPITIDGKIWAADKRYIHDNFNPIKNAALKQIYGTDADSLYFDGQSSNGDKKPFRYQFPVANGNYYVRLHFAEIYFGTTGTGNAGGAGSRVLSVKLEDQYRLTNYDILEDVGSATAVIKNFVVTVKDSNLNIDFSATINRPVLSAVEVYSFSAPVPDDDTKIKDLQLLPVHGPAISGNVVKPWVYPNPLFGRNFTVQFPAKYHGVYNMQLEDIMGRKYDLGKTKLNGAGVYKRLDISRFLLSPGVYFLNISSGNKADVIKLLIK